MHIYICIFAHHHIISPLPISILFKFPGDLAKAQGTDGFGTGLCPWPRAEPKTAPGAEAHLPSPNQDQFGTWEGQGQPMGLSGWNLLILVETHLWFYRIIG